MNYLKWWLIMHLKGAEKFLEKLPGYAGSRIFLLPILGLLSFLIGILFMLFLDIASRLFPNSYFLFLIDPILPLIGTATCGIIGFVLVSQVWHKKDKLLKKYNELAYQKAFKFAILAIPQILAIICHAYLPIGLLSSKSPVSETTIVLSSSLLSFLLGMSYFGLIVRIIGSVALFMLGLLIIFRALFTFGIDYMGLVYLYYPEESEVQDHEIYSVLRHPAYAGVLLISAGAIFARLSLYSLIFFAIILLGFLCHIRLVEEKELVVRFGASFLEYRRRVPALIVKPRMLGAFFRFLIGH
ncbi:MAG: methyltransferase family protein [Promethearchaeota archaeon]